MGNKKMCRPIVKTKTEYEAARLEALHRYQILDTAPEAAAINSIRHCRDHYQTLQNTRFNRSNSIDSKLARLSDRYSNIDLKLMAKIYSSLQASIGPPPSQNFHTLDLTLNHPAT